MGTRVTEEELASISQKISVVEADEGKLPSASELKDNFDRDKKTEKKTKKKVKKSVGKKRKKK